MAIGSEIESLLITRNSPVIVSQITRMLKVAQQQIAEVLQMTKLVSMGVWSQY